MILAPLVSLSHGQESNFQKTSKILFRVFFCFFPRAILLCRHFFYFVVFLTFTLHKQHKNMFFKRNINQSTYALRKGFSKSCYFCVKLRCFSCFLTVHKRLQNCVFSLKTRKPLYRKHLKILQILCFLEISENSTTINVYNYLKYCVSEDISENTRTDTSNHVL